MTSGQGSSPDDDAIPIEQLSTSFRFDEELAAFLTAFQYGDDGIRLTADAATRPLPEAAYDAPTTGLARVFEASGSLALICYEGQGHRMVNPIETAIIEALADALERDRTPTSRPDGGQTGALGEEPAPDGKPPSTTGESAHPPADPASRDGAPTVSMGVVTPHNAQRAALDTVPATDVNPNTVEKYQGGQRDVIAVSATVDDTDFARQEEGFILNPRRLNVAISRSRLLTIVVCSTALFEVTPIDPARLADGPIWARLFTQAVGRDADPVWEGPLAEFTPAPPAGYGETQIGVYPHTS